MLATSCSIQVSNYKDYECNIELTAAIEGFFSSPAGGCVTSAPMNITGSRNIGGLRMRVHVQMNIQCTAGWWSSKILAKI